MRTVGKCDTNRNIKAIKLFSRLDNHIPKYIIRIKRYTEISVVRFLYKNRIMKIGQFYSIQKCKNKKCIGVNNKWL